MASLIPICKTEFDDIMEHYIDSSEYYDTEYSKLSKALMKQAPIRYNPRIYCDVVDSILDILRYDYNLELIFIS